MKHAARITAFELAGAAAAAAALWHVLPLAPGDAFRSSLAVMPLAVAALRGVERFGVRAGGRRGKRRAGGVEAVLLAALVALVLHRHRLGLTVTDGFLAAGLVVLLAHRVGRLLLGLRPALGSRLPSRPSAVFFWLPLVVYLSLQPWMAEHRQPDGDEPYYLLLSHSLAYDFDTELANNYAAEDSQRFMDRALEPQPGDPRGAGGEVRSRHAPLLPLLLAPAYRIGGRPGAMTMMAILTAALAWMFLRLAHHYAPGSPGAALWVYAVFALAPPLLLYSYQIWIEVPAALLLAVALERIPALLHRSRWSALELFSLGLPLALLPLLKLRLGLLAAPLLLLAWRRIRPGKLGMGVLLGVLGSTLGGLLAYNWMRFGNPLKMHSLAELSVLSSPLGDYARGAVGMFYDCAFGLFAGAPLWMLLLPALWHLLRHRDPLLTDLAVVSLPYFVALSPRFEWYGGWSPPFRYPLALLPLLALALVPLLALRHRPGLRWLLTVLGILTAMLTLIWVLAPGWTFNFADGRTLLLDELARRLGADVARFFPSTVRPRAATWAWVAASLLLVPLALWRGRPGRRRWRPRRLAGFATVLALIAALPLLAHRWPSRRIELEDSFVSKRGGSAYPDPWVTQRPRYRGAWKVVSHSRLVAPVVAGGETVRLRLTVRFLGQRVANSLRIAAGGETLATCFVERGGWREIELGPFAWPAGAPLVIAGSRSPPGEAGAIAVDRVDLLWR